MKESDHSMSDDTKAHILKHNGKTNIGGWNIHTIYVHDKRPDQLTPIIHI